MKHYDALNNRIKLGDLILRLQNRYNQRVFTPEPVTTISDKRINRFLKPKNIIVVTAIAGNINKET